MKRILLIDNTFDPPHGSPEIKAYLEELALGPVEVVVARGPESGIPADLSGFDAAVLSGSKTRIEETAPWIEKEMDAIRFLYERKIPTLGICYGEQLIARTLGGPGFVGPSSPGNEEFGWVELEVTGDSPILKGLPRRFHTFEFHRDEVKALPEKFRITASSPACPVQAFDLSDAPMWGLQFHPERGLEAGKKSLERRVQADPACKILNQDKADLVYDPSVAKIIFRNFLEQVWVES